MDAAQTIRDCIAEVTALRLHRAGDTALGGAVGQVKALQAQRFRGTYADLRVEHMKRIAELDLPGYAIGGLAVGETAQEMYDIIDAVEPYMPADKTRYLMGVGTPTNIIEAVARGVDFFE